MTSEANNVDVSTFRAAMRAYPTGVTVVTAMGSDGPAGMTANAVSSLSLDPPLLLVCFDNSSRTLGAVREGRRFGVNVLGRDQHHLAHQFATKAAGEEKWSSTEWREQHGLPALDGAVAWIGCDLHELIEMGDHVIAIGMVRDLDVSHELEPLVFHRGGFRELT